MSTSRGGRKGKFAGYYLQIKGNNQSLLAGGIWCPDKDEMATIVCFSSSTRIFVVDENVCSGIIS